MRSFFEKIKLAAQEGHRAANIVIALQKIYGRNFSQSERDLFKEYFYSHNFTNSSSDEEIILSYIYFLVSGEPTPYGLTAPAMQQDAKIRLIKCVDDALKRKVLSEDPQFVIGWLQKAAGLDQ